ncbi:C40 family peptidase [Deinococcus peraridilitoris]|uniref:Cell wall-associated hydrolase, invasion-associated protein n=1 Tax=Deinococcus peraridilitoris (strain DSM 19664 / LMG 22246 / CIP 109416 / KR-200) TaxID=937777 RepID=K9ZWW0_DEIPD|nr:C40 family peptidase [Deinococcus peraridilitoris]AFZ66118.1 cell wall-associated hydrolase, invasion-associated protein [Deinococcus peraridilitoris DSM 19664]
MLHSWLRVALLLTSGATSALGAPIEYTVQGGDTLYAIARKFGLSIERLLADNNLSSPELRIGHRLHINSSPLPAPEATPAVGSFPHTVGPGDTLYSLARRAGVTVEALMAGNNLTSSELKIGQRLQLPVVPPGPSSLAARPSDLPTGSIALRTPVADLALRFLNVPYVYGGNSAAGLDCSGLVLQVYIPLGLQLPRRSQDQFLVGEVVERSALQEGDLVFFDTEGGGVASHVGIVLQGDRFVHASTYDRRVTVSRLDETYYAERYLGARRLLPALASRP